MSSFVVSKKELMKAAGFCAALADCRDRWNSPVLRIWNSKENRVLLPEDYAQLFERIHFLNAYSVQQQYGDEEMFLEKEDYSADLADAQKATKQIYRKATTGQTAQFEKTVYRFYNFCESVRYQIEDPAAEKDVREILDTLEAALLGVLGTIKDAGGEAKSWGEFDV